MGNRNGALSARHHLSELKGQYSLKQNLGSTFFTKTVRATFNEIDSDDDPLLNELRENQQQLVVKIFPRYLSSSEKAVHPSYNPAERLAPHAQHVDEWQRRVFTQFGTSTNCLPFHRVEKSKHAVFLLRQYVKYNLYDRLSVRPYLCAVEKRWVAFQLLNALRELHSLDLCHGDVKIENVLVNSFLWVSLADAAPYKPTYLSRDHSSADFTYFFDISGRRTCYLAPERVVRPRTVGDDQLGILDAELTPAMDVFSLGCVLAELFTERPLFDFGQLIAYANGDYDPFDELKRKIKDRNVLEMITSMLSVEPQARRSAEAYLREQHGRAFPVYFLPLKNYMAKLVSTRVSADEIVVNIKRNHLVLIENLGLDESKSLIQFLI